MHAPVHPSPTFRLEDYPFRVADNVRFADLDPQHHVNNAVYASYFETGRVMLIRNPTYGLMPEGFSWVLGHLAIDFRAEVRWPGTIDMGLGVSRIGRTSVTYKQVVFSEGKCAASAEAVTVLLDVNTRKPAPLPTETIEKFQLWMLRGV